MWVIVVGNYKESPCLKVWCPVTVSKALLKKPIKTNHTHFNVKI